MYHPLESHPSRLVGEIDTPFGVLLCSCHEPIVGSTVFFFAKSGTVRCGRKNIFILFPLHCRGFVPAGPESVRVEVFRCRRSSLFAFCLQYKFNKFCQYVAKIQSNDVR